MIIGAFLDGGFDLETLRKGLAGLTLRGYDLSAEKVKRSAITATKFNVSVDASVHHHRGLSDILGMIGASDLSTGVKEKSSAVFRRLGEVEAAIHGIPIGEVHFHEIGAVDSIVDIVGSIFICETLGIEQFYCSPLPTGNGNISTAHGILPSPAPATLQLLAAAGAPLVQAPDPSVMAGELVTPTGAVLVTMFSTFGRPDMKVARVGYGAGNKDFQAWPNIMRIWTGEKVDTGETGEMVLLETNIDDMNPQVYGYLMEKLLDDKAADVWFVPIQMKKNRPAVMLSVLGPAGLEAKLAETIMRETTTLGIRSRRVSRHTAQRDVIETETSLGRARVKIKRFGGFLAVAPEYEDCRRIARERNLPLQEVSRLIEAEARRRLDGHAGATA